MHPLRQYELLRKDIAGILRGDSRFIVRLQVQPVGVPFLCFQYGLPSYAATELLMLSLFVLTQLIRFEFARKAVNNRDGDNMRSYLIVSVLVVLAYVFFLRLQTYVTMLEVLTNSVGIGWTAIQIGLALWLVVIFYKKGKIV